MKTKRSLLGYSGLACLVMVFTIGMGCASKEEKKAGHWERAEAYLENDEFKKAIIELQNVVQLDPRDDAAHYELGEALLKVKQPKAAFQSFDRAVHANPDNEEAVLKLAQMYLLGGKAEEAKEKAKLILEKFPDNIDALLIVAGAHVQNGENAAAEKTLQQAASLDPEHRSVRMALAHLYAATNDLEKAETAYLKAISLDPSVPEPYEKLAFVYARNRELDKAESQLEQMIDACGATVSNLHVLAAFYEARGKLEEAEETLVRAVSASSDDSPAALTKLGDFYTRRNEYEKALQVMNKAAEVADEDSGTQADIRATIAQLQLNTGKIEDAESLVDDLLQKDPGHMGANFLKARLDLIEGDVEQALQRFDKVLEMDDRHAPAYFFRALCYLEEGRTKLAKKDLIQAVDLNPGHLDAQQRLAEVYFSEGSEDMAADKIDLILREVPDSHRTLMLKGKLEIVQRNLEAAESTYKGMIEKRPENAPAHVMLGLVYQMSGRQAAATTEFRKGLELNPQQMEAFELLVSGYLRDKKFEQALVLCNEQEQQMERESGALGHIAYLKGRILTETNDPGDARKQFERAIEIDPNQINAYTALAELYLNENKADEAKQQYEKILEKNPDYMPAYMFLGTLSAQEGDAVAAESYYRKALERKPDFAPAANNLAWQLAETGENLSEALRLAQTAKKQLPEDAAVSDTLGWVCIKMNAYPSAIAQLTESVSLEPENPLLHYHLGLAYAGNDEPDQARISLNRALTIDPNFDGAQEARRVLDDIDEGDSGAAG